MYYAMEEVCHGLIWCIECYEFFSYEHMIPCYMKKVLTVILQEGDVTGLHVRKQDKWMAVDPVPGALCHKLGRANAGKLQISSYTVK